MKERLQQLRWWLIAGLFVAGLGLLAGCGKSGTVLQAEHSNEGLFPEAVKVREVFASAPPALKNPVDESLKLVKAGNTSPSAYREALPQFQQLAANPMLSADQKAAIESLLVRLNSELAIANTR